MEEKEYITPKLPGGIRIKWKREFDMELLYKKMKYWLDDNGFGANLEEEEYSETIKGDAKELRIKWYAEKKESPYFAYVIEIIFLVIDLKEFIAKKEGRDVKIHKGDFEIRLEAYLLKDPEGKFSKQTQWFYEKFLIGNRISEKKRDLYSKLYQFSDTIKEFLTKY